MNSTNELAAFLRPPSPMRVGLPRGFRWRRATSPLRALPDFVIIGAMKAGTTSLFHYMAQHPRVFGAARKEVHYFDRHYDKSDNWYRAFFPLRATLALRGALACESSPLYLTQRRVPKRMYALVPEARPIVILRDPVERAWSHYRHMVHTRGEVRDFETLFAALPQHDEGYLFTDEDPLGWEQPVPAGDFCARGVYDVALRRWFEVYGRERVIVVFYEDFVRDAETVLSGLFETLGLPPAPVATGRIHNRGLELPLSEDLRARLAARFAPSDARLEKLLGRALPWR